MEPTLVASGHLKVVSACDPIHPVLAEAQLRALRQLVRAGGDQA